MQKSKQMVKRFINRF